MTYQPQPANPTVINIAQAQTTVSVTTIYTVPLRARTILQNIDIVNTSGSTATFDIYLVPQNNSASTANALYYQYSVTANNNAQWRGQQVLDSQQTIQIKGNSTAITITISGVTYGYY
jgi:hypothetical protein